MENSCSSEVIKLYQVFKHHRRIDNSESKTFLFGHHRLSIIDLSDDAHQPMIFENLTLVYNGVIYNYKELRQELSKKAMNSVPKVTPELFSKAFIFWGKAAFLNLMGCGL